MKVEPSSVEAGLRTCRRSAVHLEMRDGYMRTSPTFIAWQSGRAPNPNDPPEVWWRPWLQVIADATSRGVEVRRARIVSEPVSQYVQFEYDVTFTNLAAGEQVRWLPRRHATDLALPGNDFWLFDDEILMVNHFSGDGDSLDKELLTDPAVVQRCRLAFEAVWSRAIPHAVYRIA